MRSRILIVFLGVVLMSCAVYAQKAGGTAKPNANGEVGAAAEKAAAAQPLPAVAAHACLQLYNGNTVLWSIDAIINPNIYPYPITGGTIKGTICGSPNVTITSGALGSTLKVTAKLPNFCANPVNIIGTSTVPVGYQGTYGFYNSTNQFTHHTLFLGYNKPTCP
jgi:hypothetical protein